LQPLIPRKHQWSWLREKFWDEYSDHRERERERERERRKQKNAEGYVYTQWGATQFVIARGKWVDATCDLGGRKKKSIPSSGREIALGRGEVVIGWAHNASWRNAPESVTLMLSTTHSHHLLNQYTIQGSSEFDFGQGQNCFFHHYCVHTDPVPTPPTDFNSVCAWGSFPRIKVQVSWSWPT
jgi:hypothetical protein